MVELRDFQFANIGETELFTPINSSQTGIVVLVGAELPDPDYGAVVPLVLRDDANGKYEIMYMVDRIGNACTVERGKEGTTAQSWPAGTVVRNSVTAGFFEKLASLPATRFRTSQPYPYIFGDSMTAAASPLRYDPQLFLGGTGSEGDNTPDSLGVSGQPIEGILDTLLLTYSNYPFEAIDVRGQPIEGLMDSVLVTYSNYPHEEITLSAQPIEGVMDAVLVTYNNYQVEAIDLTCGPLSGVLT